MMYSVWVRLTGDMPFRYREFRTWARAERYRVRVNEWTRYSASNPALCG